MTDSTPKIWKGLKKGLLGLVWLVGWGGLAALAFVVCFFVAMRVELSGNQVDVPDVVGLGLEEATRQIESMQLVHDVVDRRNDPRIASGGVLEQTPPPGATVRQGRKVKLVLSLGGKVLEVPDLIGHAARAVAIELRQEGFQPGDEAHVHSYDMPTGRILAQVPASQSTAVPNSRVHRLVSDGPPSVAWVMPDLTGVTRKDAESWISDSGFRRGVVRRVEAFGQIPGTVVGQLPLAGYPVRSKDIVELAVAR